MEKAVLENIKKAIRSSNNKNSNAYKVAAYYDELTMGNLDAGGIALVRSKILNIEKYLENWTKDHPNNGTTMQPEESAITLINDLRERGFLE